MPKAFPVSETLAWKVVKDEPKLIECESNLTTAPFGARSLTRLAQTSNVRSTPLRSSRR